MDKAHRLSPDEERSRYELHKNVPDDPAYRAHLSKAIAPITAILSSGRGLDFGSGPGPTTSVILRDLGFAMENYDPFFAPETKVLDEMYDFVISTEAAEHFFYPKKEFNLLYRIVRPHGWLSIMTRLRPPHQRLDEWWYTRDPTHVSFYSAKTLTWIASNWGWRIASSSESVHLLEKAYT